MMAQMICQLPKLFSMFMLIMLMMVSKSSSAPNLLGSTCSNETINMFRNNSQYQANLNTLFRYLSSNATNPNGFHQAISSNANTTSDTIYGQFLCRGDQNISSCQDCVNTATTSDLPRTYCPNKKNAIIWYDECMVRYSNQPFFGTLDDSGGWNYWSSHNITGNTTRFMELVNNMMNYQIAVGAASGGSQKKFATDFVNYTIVQTIYGLGQCTPDLTSSDCNTCLTDAVGQLSETQGGRILRPSCVVRYETYPFFDLSSLPPPPAQPPAVAPSSNASSGIRSNSSRKLIVAIVVPIVLVLVGLLVVVICYTKYRKGKKTHVVSVESEGEDFTTLESLQYDLATLKSATDEFSNHNKVGEGGFGSVFKGTLPNGQQIAVKRLSMSSSQGVQEFKNEILLVAKLQHRNLVRLLGFCFEGQEKLLVYEYVTNKSLDNFLFESENQELLDWSKRYKIIGGIARGLLYLHHDSQLRIIHRDLKASNVLLDADLNSKISDFGMARIFGVDQSQANTSRIVGTYGYMSPEYAMHGQFSIKSDVYSFGVLVLEIISGKRNSTFYESGEAIDLLSYAWKQWRDGMILEFVDPKITNTCSHDEVMRCIHLGLLCVQECPDDRPTMATVVLTLDSYSVTLQVPEAPGLFVKSKMDSNIAKEPGSDRSSSKSAHWSVNDVSITEPEPR